MLKASKLNSFSVAKLLIYKITKYYSNIDISTENKPNSLTVLEILKISLKIWNQTYIENDYQWDRNFYDWGEN